MQHRDLIFSFKTQPRCVQEKLSGLDSRRWPGGFSDPVSWNCIETRIRGDMFLQEHRIGRLIHDARIDVLQPVIPPPQRMLKKSNRGPRDALLRVFMTPGSDEAFYGARKMGKHARHRVRIPIFPTTDRIDRTFDIRIVFTDGPMLPVFIASLMLHPNFRRGGLPLFKAFKPCLAPIRLCNLGVWRQRHGVKKTGPPEESVGKQATTHPVHIVGIAIISRAVRNDRL